jgi:hypothetical protein
MPKHTAKHAKKAAKHARTTRPVKLTHSKKPAPVKKAVAPLGPEMGGADAEEYGLELNAPHLQSVDLEALGQEPESVADVFELFEVEVVSDAEDTGQSDEPELTLENSD